MNNASRSLSETECRYAQIEKGLDLTWACERFTDYILGKRIKITNHWFQFWDPSTWIHSNHDYSNSDLDWIVLTMRWVVLVGDGKTFKKSKGFIWRVFLVTGTYYHLVLMKVYYHAGLKELLMHQNTEQKHWSYLTNVPTLNEPILFFYRYGNLYTPKWLMLLLLPTLSSIESFS